MVSDVCAWFGFIVSFVCVAWVCDECCVGVALGVL